MREDRRLGCRTRTCGKQVTPGMNATSYLFIPNQLSLILLSITSPFTLRCSQFMIVVWDTSVSFFFFFFYYK